MVEADFSGAFLSAENADDNSIIVIVDKPELEEKEYNGQTYNTTNIPVEINQKRKIYSPSRESGKRMVTAWGREMDNWVGKKATIKHVLKQIKGKTDTYIEAYPIVEEKH